MASGVIKELTDIKYIDANGRVPLVARITMTGITFTNGVGTAQVETEGHVLSENAFAVAREHNGTLSVAYAKGNPSTQSITIGLTNGSYNGTFTFLIMYFLSLQS